MASHCVLGCFLLFLTVVDGYKILMIAGISSPSHYNVFVPIIKESARRKHDVTVQAYHSLKQPHVNIRELKITPKQSERDKSLAKEFFQHCLKLGPIEIIRQDVDAKQLCLGYLNDDTTKTLVSSGMQYDLVIIDALFSYCSLAVASLVGKHIIQLYTTAFFVWIEGPAPIPPSYVPLFTDLMPSKMNFFQRFQNAINFLAVRYVNRYEIRAVQQKVVSEILPQARPVAETEKNVALSITNGDPVVNSARPTMPNIVDCGGMHCTKAKPLPQDLNDFVESSGSDGFIIFGLGSNMKSEYLSAEETQAILTAFSRLKQKVVWKFEAKLEGLPKNVKIVDWMPQQDMLGHPKARLFITHAGLLSLQEAIYHGVPVIGMPFFADQRGNIIRMKELGLGEHFDFLNITADGFYEVINRVLNDKSYYENMKKYTAIFKDRPERPVDRAVYWIEYVIRHDGARHFRSAGEDLNYFQYFLLDVITFVIFVALLSLGFTTFMLKLCVKKFWKKEHLNDELEKKTN